MEHLDVKLSLRILRSGTLSRKYFVERIVFSTLRSDDFAEKKKRKRRRRKKKKMERKEVKKIVLLQEDSLTEFNE